MRADTRELFLVANDGCVMRKGSDYGTEHGAHMRLCSAASQPVMDPAAILTRGNQASLLEELHVFRDRGGRETQERDQGADAHFTAAEGHQRAETLRIAEGFGEARDLAHVYRGNLSRHCITLRQVTNNHSIRRYSCQGGAV